VPSLDSSHLSQHFFSNSSKLLYETHIYWQKKIFKQPISYYHHFPHFNKEFVFIRGNFTLFLTLCSQDRIRDIFWRSENGVHLIQLLLFTPIIKLHRTVPLQWVGRHYFYKEIPYLSKIKLCQRDYELFILPSISELATQHNELLCCYSNVIRKYTQLKEVNYWALYVIRYCIPWICVHKSVTVSLLQIKTNMWAHEKSNDS
jgi:hypothetical protein